MTPQALEALVLGVHLLGVRRILVVPHTRCAMASSTLDELRDRVGQSAGTDASWQTFGDLLFKTSMQRDPHTPEEQAAPLVFLNSDAARGVSGQVLNVDAGYSAGALMGVHESPVIDAIVDRSVPG